MKTLKLLGRTRHAKALGRVRRLKYDPRMIVAEMTVCHVLENNRIIDSAGFAHALDERLLKNTGVGGRACEKGGGSPRRLEVVEISRSNASALSASTCQWA